jgi:hypothetical protein
MKFVQKIFLSFEHSLAHVERTYQLCLAFLGGERIVEHVPRLPKHVVAVLALALITQLLKQEK